MLNITNPYPQQFQTQVRQGYLDYLRQQMVAKQQEYILYREYDDGTHRTQLTERQRQYLKAHQDVEFTANYCPMVIDAKTNRLKINGFTCDDKTQADTLWSWWRKNRMDGKQNVVHRAAVRDGDAFVLVEWDNAAKLPRFYFEPGYAGDGVMVYYSDERRDEIEFASKHWRVSKGMNAGKVRRMNLYFPDHIEKYISDDDSDSGSYLPYEGDADEIGPGYLGLAGIVWWTDTRAKGGVPLGIPIVHFKHNDKGDSYGTSHLADVLPIQDAVDKALIDLVSAMDTDVFGLLAGYGTTDWSTVKVGPGAIAAVSKGANEGAKLERVNGDDSTTKLLAGYSALVMEIARISGTPLSYFQVSGQISAEGTMKQQELALVSQVKKTQTDFGNSWEQVFTIARRLDNAFGEGGLNEDELIEAVWEGAESRNDMEQAQTLAIRVSQLGVSETQAQTEMGYNTDEIAAFKREKMRNQAMALRIAAGNSTAPPGTAAPDGQAEKQTMTQTENMHDAGRTTAAQ